MSRLEEAVAALIESATDTSARIRRRGAVGGGCISQAEIIELEDGRRYFLKSNADGPADLFERELEGLRALGEVGAVRVPEVIGSGGFPPAGDGLPPFLVLEAIESGAPARDYQESFGRQLARLHRESRQERFGFVADNYLGSTPQPNPWKSDWVEFWREARLGFQLDLARRQGRSDATLDRLGERLLERLPEFIEEPAEPACLLHGDLWGGNAMTDSRGQPVIIDPAAYFGRREAELAMTQLFGGFTAEFYRAYEEVWPLADGHEERLAIYRLYHLLNHLNLFGSSYRSGCLEILKRLVG